MALQGTLDTFELPDVLRLLSSTRKSGRLHLRCDRGDGDVWMIDGKVVGVEAMTAPSADPADSLFELLRAREGSFAFDAGSEPAEPGAPADVEPMLAAAEEQIAEWRLIEAVVPSMDAWVGLATDLPEAEVSIDAATWRLIATIGSGLTVADLGRTLDLAEVPACRIVRDLVELGLGAVSTGPAPSWSPVGASTLDVELTAGPLTSGSLSSPPSDPSARFADLPSLVPEMDYQTWAASEEAEQTEQTAVFTVDEPVGYATEVVEPTAEPLPAPAPPPSSVAAAPAAGEDDEVNRQLAMLSPRAAQALAATAGPDGTSQGGSPEADGDDAVDRGVLLKFLSSVKS